MEPYTIILETPRLTLRRQVSADLDALWALYCDPQIVKYIPDAPRSREEAREELEWHMHGHPKNQDLGLWATIHKESGRFIGRCGLLPWMIDGRQEVEVAYTIAQDFWGQGLGTEAARAIMQYGFAKLQLPRLISVIDPDNIASQRVAQKIGMQLEQQLELDNLPMLIYSISKQNDQWAE